MKRASNTFILTLLLWASCLNEGRGLIGDVLGGCSGDLGSGHWTYINDDSGPAHWGEKFHECDGKKQSPIDINTNGISNPPASPNEMECAQDVVKCANIASQEDTAEGGKLKKMVFLNYNGPLEKAKAVNNGHTIKVSPNDDIFRGVIIDGVNFTFAQLHFHWGSKNGVGSEHTVNGGSASMELHFVHTSKSTNQLAVVGVLFIATKSGTRELNKILSQMGGSYDDDEEFLDNKLVIEKLLPENPASFYRYSGSLTTPPCDEVVIWSVLKKTANISHKQLNEFRSTKTSHESDDVKCPMVDNFRPIQPLNGRKLYESN